MIQLPALISKRGGAAARLEKAQAERERISAIVDELCAKLNGLDVEADDFSAASLTLDGQIHVHQKALAIAELRVAGLAHKVEIDARAEAKARREAATRKVQAELLPLYFKGVEEHAAALLGPRATKAKLNAIIERISKEWPVDDLPRPAAFYFDAEPGRRFERADRAQQASLAADDADAKEIAANFVARECEFMADLINGWKEPLPAETEEAA